ncbi:MAG: shikimate kinase [Pseudomonadota bacterium]|nr:shikimate kinase [Pseudomonadota bacterium]HJO36778.1 shikimate kinase [Gammaproteobacteria bacterium]
MTTPRPAPERIFLIGPMGAGKTTVGRRLAALLHYPFVDCDEELRARTGVDIPYIFEREGEAGFRERERRLIGELTERSPIVLSTGGGAVLDAGNRHHLHARGQVIFLNTPTREILRRLRHSKTRRPLLETADPAATLRALAAERNPLYRETAHLVIDTDARNPRAVAHRIARQLQAR